MKFEATILYVVLSRFEYVYITISSHPNVTVIVELE